MRFLLTGGAITCLSLIAFSAPLKAEEVVNVDQELYDEYLEKCFVPHMQNGGLNLSTFNEGSKCMKEGGIDFQFSEDGTVANYLPDFEPTTPEEPQTEPQVIEVKKTRNYDRKNYIYNKSSDKKGPKPILLFDNTH